VPEAAAPFDDPAVARFRDLEAAAGRCPELADCFA
jgi:hypothetical protein